MLTARSWLAVGVATFGCTFLRSTIEILVTDPGRRSLVTFLLALIGFAALGLGLAIRVWFEGLEKKLTKERMDERDEALLVAIQGGGKNRLRSIDN